jgi:hypothetical protein
MKDSCGKGADHRKDEINGRKCKSKTHSKHDWQTRKTSQGLAGDDTPEIRGMINKVSHLVSIEEKVDETS